MTAVLNQTSKAEVKSQLEKISSILQYLSFETMEQMLFSMKTLNLAKLQKEFLMLTMFHASEFKAKVDKMPLEEHTKQSIVAQVDDVFAQLCQVADFDPQSVTNDANQFISQVRLARD